MSQKNAELAANTPTEYYKDASRRHDGESSSAYVAGRGWGRLSFYSGCAFSPRPDVVAPELDPVSRGQRSILALMSCFMFAFAAGWLSDMPNSSTTAFSVFGSTVGGLFGLTGAAIWLQRHAERESGLLRRFVFTFGAAVGAFTGLALTSLKTFIMDQQPDALRLYVAAPILPIAVVDWWSFASSARREPIGPHADAYRGGNRIDRRVDTAGGSRGSCCSRRRVRAWLPTAQRLPTTKRSCSTATCLPRPASRMLRNIPQRRRLAHRLSSQTWSPRMAASLSRTAAG